MPNRLNKIPLRQRATKLTRSAGHYVRRLFRFEARALFRQNAIRAAIASLIETERMRLALTIGHRDDD
jgi:hypothetical protein